MRGYSLMVSILFFPFFSSASLHRSFIGEKKGIEGVRDIESGREG